MTHEVFTIVAPIPDRAASTHLKQILAEINANPSENARLPFGKLPMVHFASFVVFSDPVQEAAGAASAGPPGLRKLHRWALRRVHQSASPPGPADSSRAVLVLPRLRRRVPSCDGVRAYIVANRRKPHLLHIGSPGLRVDHIKAGDSLRRVLDRELDDVVKRGRSTDRPLDLMRALRASLNVPPSTRDHWFLREPTLTRDRTTALRMVCRSAVSPHFAALALGKAHCAGASAVGSPVVERLMALEARRGTFGGERGVCGGRRDLGLLVVADPRKAMAGAEEAEG